MPAWLGAKTAPNHAGLLHSYFGLFIATVEHSMYISKIAVCMIAALLLLQPLSANQTATQEKAEFTERTASQLLDQIKEGLESRISKKVLNAFDLSRMNSSAAFKNQITAMLGQYEFVRVHFSLLETSVNGPEASAVVDVEMEENPPGDVSAPVHKHAQLRFTAQNGPKGWKFTDVQPRSF